MLPLTVKARTGRPRKAGARAPSGRLSRARTAIGRLEDAERATVVAQRRRLGASEDNARDQRWATPWGRLLLTGRLTPARYQAAEEMARLIGLARKAMDARAPWTSAVDLLRAGGAAPAEEDVKRTRRDLERHGAAVRALMRAGSRASDAATRMLGLQQDPAPGDVALIQTGLGELARHFGFRGPGAGAR
jgi:hypothetical protein